jgi:hypothetical protein
VFAESLAVARRGWAAIVLVAAFPLFVALDGSGFPLLNQALLAARMVVALFLFLRVGILAAVAFLFAGFVVQVAPLTLDESAWYFGASLTYFAAVIGLAAVAAYTATAGRLFGTAGTGDD